MIFPDFEKHRASGLCRIYEELEGHGEPVLQRGDVQAEYIHFVNVPQLASPNIEKAQRGSH